MEVYIGKKAPNLKVSEWVQGKETNIDKEIGKVVLVQVFQVNCPGAVYDGMKEAVKVYDRYKRSDVTVLGLATAFEDYDKNTISNLRKMLKDGKVVGDTEIYGRGNGLLDGDGKLSYKIPFPVSMDSIVEGVGATKDRCEGISMSAFCKNFGDLDADQKSMVMNHLKNKPLAETFEGYNLQGTPSSIIVDGMGKLRHVLFSDTDRIEKLVAGLVKEKYAAPNKV
jgi:hypothetical protein